MSSTAGKAAPKPVTGGWSIDEKRVKQGAVALFLFARLVTLLALPLEGLRGYGDLANFYRQAQIPGWPYLNYWTEFPPVFPFLSAALYRLGGGTEHTYDYLLIFILTLADLGSLLLFWRLAKKVHGPASAIIRVVVYLIVLIVLPYCWWYFDPLAVFFMLLGLVWLNEGKEGQAGLALGLGAAVKLFPLLALVWAWRAMPLKRSIRATVLALAVPVVLYGALWAASPQFTLASLRSQASKGSWETVWALLDGNAQTGNFGPLIERLDPAKASQPTGNPARVPPLLSLAAFAAVGLYGFRKAKRPGELAGLSLVGLAWSLFLLWSPGWSVQWLLYLLPPVVLLFPLRMALLLGGALVLVNLMEWPVLLSRGLFNLLAGPVLLRTLLLALMALLFYRQAVTGEMAEQEK